MASGTVHRYDFHLNCIHHIIVKFLLQISCGARCAAVGDPHYLTFDGKRYDFMGQCSYYLVKTDEFTIEAENVACAGSISQAMNFPASVSSGNNEFKICIKVLQFSVERFYRFAILY